MAPITFVLIILFLCQAAVTSEISTFLTNGESAHAGEFPHVATVIIKQPGKPDQFKCGGSIINERWILTSATCGINRTRGKLFVKVGQHRLDEDSEYVQTQEVSLVIIPQDFDQISLERIQKYDIALLKIASPLLLNQRVQPIQLPDNNTSISGTAISTGFAAEGRQRFPRILQKVNVTVISSGSCGDAVTSLSPINRYRITDEHLCTGPLDRITTLCINDIGNPLIKQGRGGTVLIGVTIWHAAFCDQRGAPAVYTRISEYMDWIIDRITEN